VELGRTLETSHDVRRCLVQDSEPRPGPADPDPHPERRLDPEDIADALSRDIVTIHRDSYGRTAGRVVAHVLDDTVIVILDDLELLPNEKYLIEQGRAAAVVGVREEFQQAIASTFTAAVERATGRRVIGFASHVQVDEPRFAVEVFRLAPET
jgi:uncharacterized protein YbcI